MSFSERGHTPCILSWLPAREIKEVLGNSCQPEPALALHSHMTFPFADFALSPFIVIDQVVRYYMWEPVKLPTESGASGWSWVPLTWSLTPESHVFSQHP